MHPLYPYLHKLQHPYSGLIESYPLSPVDYLHKVGFTYDLSLAALVLIHHGSLDEAGRIIEFFRSMPLPTQGGWNFNTAYNVFRRAPALDEGMQVGPIAWSALALIRYSQSTGQMLYRHKAILLLDWIRRQVPHFQGGLVMGIEDPWESRMSVENNWAYYAALHALCPLLPHGLLRETFEQEERLVRIWLARQGGSRGQEDPVKALDVYTSALLVGPEAHLSQTFGNDPRALATWVKPWISEMIALFRVPGTAAFDYADAKEAQRTDRPRVGWLEGTEQVSIALRLWAPWLRAMGDTVFADDIEQLAAAAHDHVISRCLTVHGLIAIPNTDSREPVRTFADGWVARPDNEPALNGTTWAYFSDVGFNPYTGTLLHS